jgi:twitching motility protein PilT
MQDFDTVIKYMIETGRVSLEDGLAFATNQNNLLLSLKGVTAAEEFLQRGGEAMPMNALSDSGSLLNMIE